MKFTKMHGCGNDYIYIDCFKERCVDTPSELAKQLSHRHFGVGSDGLILIKPAEEGADVTMEMYNADGSLAEMCGNGLRCVVKYVFDRSIVKRRAMRVKTGAGVLSARVAKCRGDVAEEISLEMGRPVLQAERIPTTWTGEKIVNHPMEIEGERFFVTCVNMGNPHVVIFVDDLHTFPVAHFGPLIENAPYFPNRINVEFVEVASRNKVMQRTWERGAGETWACGTGAAAVCVAGALNDRTDRHLEVELLGGMLRLDWGEDGMVTLTGPAVEVFSGEIN